MADHQEHEEVKSESLLEKISGKLHDHDSSSSSDSDNEKEKKTSSPTSLKNKVFRLFGREKPLHNVLGGGKRMRLSFSSFAILQFVVLLVLSKIEVNRF
jgi:hypothetical protein